MLDFLSPEILLGIKKLNIDLIYQIRLRVNFPIKIIYDGKEYFLSQSGLSICRTNAITTTINDIDYVINCVTQHSIYSFNDSIKYGYISTDKGVRIGLAGECVFENGKIITIKNIRSLNIRVPHNIIGCANSLCNKIFSDCIKNTILISPPFYGKTTLLKDIARIVGEKENTLIIDERGEFSSVEGENIDKVIYSNKLYALDFSIRSLSPSVVITDELSSFDDWKCVKKASDSGVNIIASIHGKTITDIRGKDCFIDGIFDRYVVLKSSGQAGVVENIYDKTFNLI